MAQAKQGDVVQIHYVGTLTDGSTFDSSKGREPLEFTIGAGHVIPGFEAMVIGMSPGESKKGTIAAEQAYGGRNDEYVFRVERSDLPPDLEPEVGQQLLMQTDDGTPVPVRIVGVEADAVFIDANHPLAGLDLTFEIELVAIEGPQPKIEVISG